MPSLLLFIETYQTIIVASFAGVVGVFTGMLATIYGHLKFKELRLRKVEQVIGRKVLIGEDSLATVRVMEACKSELIEDYKQHSKDEVKSIKRLEENVQYMRERFDVLLMELAKK